MKRGVGNVYIYVYYLYTCPPRAREHRFPRTIEWEAKMIKRYIDLEPDNRKGGYTIKKKNRAGQRGGYRAGESYVVGHRHKRHVPFRPQCKSMMMVMLFMDEC